MKAASITCNTGEFVFDKKKNSIADTCGKYLNESSYNNTYRMITLVIVLMGALLVHVDPGVSAYAKEVPFWMPFPVAGNVVPLQYFVVNITHSTDALGVTKTCVTDINTTHGACHYMNATEEETQAGGDVFTADAGAFVFHPGTDLISGDTLQICFHSLTLDRTACFYTNNDDPKIITKVNIDVANMLTHSPALIEKPEIGMFSFGGGVV